MVLPSVRSEDDSERKKEDLAQLLAQHTCLERNKRCLLAYVKTRADELLRLRWECGTSVLQPHLQVTDSFVLCVWFRLC